MSSVRQRAPFFCLLLPLLRIVFFFDVNDLFSSLLVDHIKENDEGMQQQQPEHDMQIVSEIIMIWS